MLKRISGVLALVGLAAGAAVYLSSCAQVSGPLSPEIKRNTAGDTNGSILLTTTLSGSVIPSSVSETARVRFNLPLDLATVNTNNIRVYTLSADGLTEALYNNYTLSYVASAQTVVFTPTTGGVWADNTAYRVEIRTSVHSVAGAQLDGNGNNIPESEEFDNYNISLSLGTPAFTYTSKNKAVNVLSAVWASNANPPGTSFNFGDNVGYISATYSHITITVQFSTTGGVPADFAMDPNTFSTGSNTLHSNVVFTDANNNPITPLSISVFSTAYPDDTLQLVFNNLQPSSKYLFKLKGGLNGIRSTGGAATRLSNHFYFDGDDDGDAEASDDTEPAVFMTQTGEAQNIPRVYVVSAIYNSTLRRYTVTINVPTGIGILDPAYVNNNYFLLWNASHGIPIVPASISLDNSTAPNPIVYVYVPLKITPWGSGNMDVYLTVRKEVRSSDGISLDQTPPAGDGVLLMDDDNFQSSSTSILGY
ncbi:MAG: Ig-like domain-containing protein [candidate division FCPU426 bacterium]